MAQALGIITITINGQTLDTLPGTKFDMGGAINKPLVTNSRVHYVQSFKESHLECEVAFTTGTDITAFMGTDLSITIQCDTGQSYVMAGAFYAGDKGAELDGKDGKVKLVYNGMPAQPYS